jgi:hypothetical protein
MGFTVDVGNCLFVGHAAMVGVEKAIRIGCRPLRDRRRVYRRRIAAAIAGTPGTGAIAGQLVSIVGNNAPGLPSCGVHELRHG